MAVDTHTAITPMYNVTVFLGKVCQCQDSSLHLYLVECNEFHQGFIGNFPVSHQSVQRVEGADFDQQHHITCFSDLHSNKDNAVSGRAQKVAAEAADAMQPTHINGKSQSASKSHAVVCTVHVLIRTALLHVY